MVVLPVQVLAGCMAAIFAGVAPCHTSTESIDVTAKAAVEALPAEIRPFFSSRREALTAAAHPDSVAALGSDNRKGNSHSIALDVIAAPTTTGDTVSRFPRRLSKARKLFKERGVEDGGRLPWALMDGYRRLVQAFRQGEADTVVRRAGFVLHYATDAGMPFSTTLDPDGRRTENRTWNLTSESDPIGDHRTVRHRCQIELVRRIAERISYEVRVWPARVRAQLNPSEAVWQTLMTTHDTLSSLLAIDRELLGQMGIKTSAEFLASADGYYELLAARAAPIIETRIESAALLAAELISAAWIEAGRPRPSRENGHTQAAVDAGTRAETAAAPFLGSRNSLVFHRRTCRHVKRIRPENLVSISTAAEAVRAGRKPCKTCSPASPAP